jgi:Ni/Fe-hydrogenase subunit HybB-like protein
MLQSKAIGGPIWTKPFKILTVFAVIAIVLILKRYLFGLASVTNLNDGYPWGLWITYDVVTGTAIACGGYAMALLVYIFNRGQYHPLVRSALLASMFGYTLAGVSIYIDVGRWWQLHNIFLPAYANINSIMFEVAFCVAAYVMVMWIEFSPAFFEGRPGQEKKLKFVNRFMIIFIALGVLLPTMHQSSLGSMMIIGGDKLSALWQTMFLPMLFLITAVAMGYGMVVFESMFSSIGFKRPLETPLLSKISVLVPRLLLAFFIIRYADLIWRGAIGEIVAFDLNSIMFIIENLIYLYALVILWSEKNRKIPYKLFSGAVAMVFAGALYRFNTYMIGYNPGNGYSYFPSFQEIMITVGIIAMEIMAYLIIVKKFPVLPEVKHV